MDWLADMAGGKVAFYGANVQQVQRNWEVPTVQGNGAFGIFRIWPCQEFSSRMCVLQQFRCVQSLSWLRAEVAGGLRGTAFMAIFLIISAVVLLFLAPGYWVFAVATFLVTGVLATQHVISADMFRGLVVALAVLGWVWRGYRFWHPVRSAQEQLEERWEQASLREATDPEQTVKTEQRQAKLDAMRARRLAEREGILKENKALLDRVAELLAECSAPVSEILRATKASSGEDVVRPPELFLIVDIMHIILRIGVASGSDMAVVARLFAGVQIRIEPSIRSDYGANEALQKLREFGAKLDNRLEAPAMLPLLASYDKLQGTHLAARAAETYLLVVEAASACCGCSVAVRMIADRYAELLKPFIVSDQGDTNAGKSGATSSGPADRRAACQRCVKSYRILDLPINSGPDAVKSKRRAFVEFLHPDQLGSKTEQARRAAEEQLKNVNEACDHILRDHAAN